MHKTLRWMIAMAAALAVNTASAQAGLLEIYRLAAINDPSLREAEANYLATAETKPQARSSLLPNINVGGSESGRYTDNRQPLGIGAINFAQGSIQRSNNDSFDLNISQTIFDLSRLRTLRQADKIIAQAELNLEAARQDLLLRVANGYFNVLSAEELVAAESASVEAIGRQLEQAQRRFDVGLIAITDVQQAQAAYDNAVAVRIGAERNLSSMQEFLREIIGEYVTNLRGPQRGIAAVAAQSCVSGRLGIDRNAAKPRACGKPRRQRHCSGRHPHSPRSENADTESQRWFQYRLF